jgi:hypothetical protein
MVLTPIAAAAQGPASIGVKGGVNIAKLKFDSDAEQVDVKNLVGAVAGLFLSKPISDNVGVRIEGLFSQKGAKNQESGEDAKYKLTYIDVPALLVFGPSSSGNTHFNVFTGPQVSFKTKAEFEFAGQTEDADNQVKGTDFGWVVGAGLESGRLTADARYTLGLSNIAESGNKVKNRVFAVMVGVKLK